MYPQANTSGPGELRVTVGHASLHFAASRVPPPPRNETVLQIFLPQSMGLWDQLPPNPLVGLPGLKDDVVLSKEDYSFYCDTCQRGFYQKQRYDAHMEEHMWCTHEGCKFTCLKVKAWKMEMHVEALHNRPDAPNLLDVEKYLSQRKSRFPTKELVQSKVEELFYKAARGEVLPDERRRWMRQHGIVIKKRPNSERAFISSNAHASTMKDEAEAGEEEDMEKRRVKKLQRLEHAQGGGGAAAGPAPPSTRPVKLIPKGPNGKLSKSQLVQLVRTKYQEATTVPPFYVCNRCGTKGVHWVSACPTAGNHEFDRQVVWAHPRANSSASAEANGVPGSTVEWPHRTDIDSETLQPNKVVEDIDDVAPSAVTGATSSMSSTTLFG